MRYLIAVIFLSSFLVGRVTCDVVESGKVKNAMDEDNNESWWSFGQSLVFGRDEHTIIENDAQSKRRDIDEPGFIKRTYNGIRNRVSNIRTSIHKKIFGENNGEPKKFLFSTVIDEILKVSNRIMRGNDVRHKPGKDTTHDDGETSTNTIYKQADDDYEVDMDIRSLPKVAFKPESDKVKDIIGKTNVNVRDSVSKGAANEKSLIDSTNTERDKKENPNREMLNALSVLLSGHLKDEGLYVIQDGVSASAIATEENMLDYYGKATADKERDLMNNVLKKREEGNNFQDEMKIRNEEVRQMAYDAMDNLDKIKAS